MSQLKHRIVNRMTMTTAEFVGFFEGLCAFLREISSRRLLLIPVDSRKRRHGAIPVRAVLDRRDRSSQRPWPLCRFERD